MNVSDRDTFFKAIGAHFGWVNEWWVPFAQEWARWENTQAEFNPLATTQPYAGATEFNPDGVKNYASVDDGVAATIATLDPTAYGGIDYFPTIRAVVRRMSVAELLPRLISEIQTWGTYGFAHALANGFTPNAVLPPEPTPTLTLENVYAYVDALNTAVIGLLETLSKETALTGTYKAGGVEGLNAI